MRSIRRRAGWSMVAKKSGSVTATRSTGICSRANHTRMEDGMRSSVRMLWNSSATISMVARSSGVAAAFFSACLRWCNSSSSTGAVTRGSPRWVVGETRWRMARSAESMALASAGDSPVDSPEDGAGASGRGDRSGPGPRVLFAKLGTWRAIRRFSRPSTASACSRLRASGAPRVIRRVSSPMWRLEPPPIQWPGPRPLAAKPAEFGYSDAAPSAMEAELPSPVKPLAQPPPIWVPGCVRERRMKGRRSTSGSTSFSTSQRLVSW